MIPRREFIAGLEAQWRHGPSRRALSSPHRYSSHRGVGTMAGRKSCGNSTAANPKRTHEKPLMIRLQKYGRTDRRCGRLLWKGLRRDYSRLAGAALSNSRTGAQAQSMGRIVAVPLEPASGLREDRIRSDWQVSLAEAIATNCDRHEASSRNGMVGRSSRARCARHCNSDGCDAAPNGK